MTRYSRLMRDIIQSGVQDQGPHALGHARQQPHERPEEPGRLHHRGQGRRASSAQGIVSIEQTLRKAQTRFNEWLRLDADERTVDGLLDVLNFDYFKLLDLLTIARSRKHIEKYYDLDGDRRLPGAR